jgi:hypothetical protein
VVNPQKLSREFVKIHNINGFEDFYDEYVWKGINVTGGNVDMYTFYPYAKGETDPWWSSRNALTTAEEGAGDFSYYYIVYPATTYVNSSRLLLYL